MRGKIEREGNGDLGDGKIFIPERASGSMRDEEVSQGDILRIKKDIHIYIYREIYI